MSTHRIFDISAVIFTLRLHPCAHQSQWVAGQLATGTGDGPAAHQHQNARVGGVFGVVRQPGALQTLDTAETSSETFTHSSSRTSGVE